ncbi:MAG: pyridoxal-phosphate dependent enzyme [Eudoraea sp.]|nr:pyridoxal-phosphate dependent enzyme [Eudoraea sp.]
MLLRVPTQEILLPELKEKKVRLFVRREDTIHPLLSGNKYRKLKYNLEAAKEGGYQRLITFGGAFSNHITATAFAGKEKGFATVGIIRGDELKDSWQLNPTLALANELGMQFKFVSREAYRTKNDADFTEQLLEEYGAAYILPEGGTNTLAIKGCQEILSQEDAHFDVICSSVGTGGTLAGLINASFPNQHILGFPALKGDFLQKDICSFVEKTNWELITAYHFGGYAKVSEALITFINDFKKGTGILLDPVYTGKMMFGILDQIRSGSFKEGTRILAIHTGGLQGIHGMNEYLKKKELPVIEL